MTGLPRCLTHLFEPVDPRKGRHETAITMAADYYQVLGVSRTATEDQIRKAYKRIARENHPDVRPNDPAAAERFKQASEAYEVLSDPDKRKQYDTFGAAWKHAGQAGLGGPFPGGGQQVDLDEIFGRGGAGGVDLEELLGGMFGGGRRARRGPTARRGRDVRMEVTVPFMTAARGGTYDVRPAHPSGGATLAVKVPPGIRDGGVIRLAVDGEPGLMVCPAGDLRLTIHVAAHPYFRREGNDLLLDLPLSFTEAALGARVDVPTLSGETVTLTVPPGTSSGAKLRLKGQGLPDPKTNERGDQYAVVKIVAPKQVSGRARELLEQLDREAPAHPRAGLW